MPLKDFKFVWGGDIIRLPFFNSMTDYGREEWKSR